MKAKKILFVLVALLSAGASNSWADGYRGHYRGSVGVYIGPGAYWGPGYARPYYYPGFYPYPYVDPYYGVAPIVVPSTPPVYIEQRDAVVEKPQNTDRQYWYYCSGSKKYYPYVKECPGGWQKVLPQPAQ